ncbi:MAG TPA: helix-turn-helix domain-containing protein [Acidimicrobiales bacterium]|nr:helix-turn-helix domain-containing protein [Acidimicrobiales bacterium]
MDLTALFSNPVDPNPLTKNPRSDYDAGVAASADRPRKEVQRRLTSDQVADLVRRYQDGETAELLATAFQIHRTTVTGHLQRNGIQRRGGGRRVLAADDVQVAVELYETGQSLASIGRQFDVHHTTVARELQQAGVEIRPRRGWAYPEPG